MSNAKKTTQHQDKNEDKPPPVLLTCLKYNLCDRFYRPGSGAIMLVPRQGFFDIFLNTLINARCRQRTTFLRMGSGRLWVAAAKESQRESSVIHFAPAVPVPIPPHPTPTKNHACRGKPDRSFLGGAETARLLPNKVWWRKEGPISRQWVQGLAFPTRGEGSWRNSSGRILKFRVLVGGGRGKRRHFKGGTATYRDTPF